MVALPSSFFPLPRKSGEKSGLPQIIIRAKTRTRQNAKDMPRRDLSVNQRHQAEVVIVSAALGARQRDLDSDSEAEEEACRLRRRVRYLLIWREAPRLNWLPFRNYVHKHLDDFSDEECESLFRFRTIADVKRLTAALGVPNPVLTPSRYAWTAEDAVMILLARFARRDTLDKLAMDFGRRPSAVSEVLHAMYSFLWDRFYEPLLDLQRWKAHIPGWADAVHRKGAPLQDCWGFVDCTLCPIARPGVNQREFYSGHKRHHGQKFLGVTAPCGLAVFIWGLCGGRRHDSHALDQSALLDELAALHSHFLRQFCLYGDAAFPHSVHLQVGYRGAALNALMQLFNQWMSGSRIAVEWDFGQVGRLFPYALHKQAMLVGSMPVGKIFFAAFLLKNCHACIYGNIISSYFEMTPPTVEDYLNINADVPL